MVTAHVTDAWTRVEDRERTLYGYTVIIAGLAAPLFLFLAGLTLSMAASARATLVGHREAAGMACRRALQIFALAFLFRLQAQLLGWGPLINLLKVDILNIMGLAMLAAAILWSLSPHRAIRIALFALATAALAMSTPLVREAGWLAMLPDAIEAYVRPLAGRTNFALFPWAGFLLGGAIAGELIQAAQTARTERRLQFGLLMAGVMGIAVAYALSFQPSIYTNANFWTSSPTFFFMRLGLNTALLPTAWAIDRFHVLVRQRWPALFTAPDVPGARDHHARPLVALRLLDSRGDGVRHPRLAAAALDAAGAVVARHILVVRAAVRDRALEGRQASGCAIDRAFQNPQPGSEVVGRCIRSGIVSRHALSPVGERGVRRRASTSSSRSPRAKSARRSANRAARCRPGKYRSAAGE